MKLSQNLNANGYEIRNIHVESIAAPAFSSVDTARLIYDSGILKYNNGVAWQTISIGTGATSTTLGTIQLAGDLAGSGSTATSPKLTAANASITSMSSVATLSNTTLTISGILSLGSTPVTVSNAAGNILTSALSGTITAGNFPALTGDVTTTAGSLATTLAATTNGTLTSLTALTSINNAGALRLATNNAIGQATATNAALIFGGTVASLATNSSYGISLNSTLTPDTAQTAVGIYSNPTVATTAATTYAGAYGMLIPAIAKTGTGTVTNAYGIYSNAPTAGATNYAGYFSGNVSVVGNLVNTGNLTSTGILVLGSGPTTVSNAAGNLLASALTGTLPATSEPAHTGDVTNSAGSLALSLVATTNATLVTLSAITTLNSAGNIRVGTNVGIGQAPVGGTALGVTGNAVITGTITAGSGANILTTVAGLLDATKLTGAASGLSSVTTTGDVSVGGNLNITGQINETTVQQLSVADFDINLANTASTATSTFTSPTYTSGALTDARSPGINVMRYSASAQRQDVSFVWNEAAKRWVLSSLKSGAATTDTPSLLTVPLIYTVASTTANPMVVVHNLNASFPVVQVFETSTGLQTFPDTTITDANTVSISFGTAPTASQYTVVILG